MAGHGAVLPDNYGQVDLSMTSSGTFAKLIASAALVMAISAFMLGSAPFTPAMILAVVAIPLAVANIFLGMPRLSVSTLYWAVAAFMSVPLSGWLQIRIDHTLVALAIVGIAVSSSLYLHYVRERSAG
jgi:hypothetical protein